MASCVAEQGYSFLIIVDAVGVVQDREHIFIIHSDGWTTNECII